LLIGVEAEKSKSVSSSSASSRKAENTSRGGDGMPKNGLENNKTVKSTHENNEIKQTAADASSSNATKTSGTQMQAAKNASSLITIACDAGGRDVQILKVEEDNGECSNRSGNES
jgi:hypothetical protein